MEIIIAMLIVETIIFVCLIFDILLLLVSTRCKNNVGQAAVSESDNAKFPIRRTDSILNPTLPTDFRDLSASCKRRTTVLVK